jgi:hypothetical protein
MVAAGVLAIPASGMTAALAAKPDTTSLMQKL